MSRGTSRVGGDICDHTVPKDDGASQGYLTSVRMSTVYDCRLLADTACNTQQSILMGLKDVAKQDFVSGNPQRETEKPDSLQQ